MRRAAYVICVCIGAFLFLTTCEYLNLAGEDGGEIHLFWNGTEVLNNGEVDFGYSPDGSPLMGTLEIQNHGDKALRLLSQVQIDNTEGEFSVTLQPDSSISPRSSSKCELEFAPSDAGIKEALLTVESSDELISMFQIVLRASSDVTASQSSFRVEIPDMTGDSMFTASVQAENGDVYLAGKMHTGGSGFDIFLMKLNSSGEHDTAFGDQGYFIFPGKSGTNSYVRNLILIEGASGVEKILIGGRTFLSPVSENFYDGTIIQVNADGTLDNGFAGNGFYLVDNSSRASDGWIARDPSTGNIFVSGGEVNSPYDNRIYRLTSSGTLDLTFNSVGYIDIDPYGWTDYHRAPWLYSGALYIPTYSFVYGNNNKAYGGILKYSLNGVLDGSFGETNSGTTDYGDTKSGKDGWAMWPAYNESTSQWEDASNYMILSSDGDFVLTGRDALSDNGATQRGFVAKYDSRGYPVSGFAANGSFTDNAGVGSVNCSTTFLTCDSSGNIYVRGYNYDSGSPNVFKLSSSGVLQTSFGDVGYIFEKDYNLFIYSLLALSSGDLLLLGRTSDTGYPAARLFNSNGIPK
ncbi:hypothetical protein [Salinispira pacifica]|uniref:Putative Ca2+-binding protein n=1 Tax=Salinispira pacifica TaxID=1307761 RepID=V5WF32_9SPIO|nr:hypothetical protein [Salinispira pacifica]AHC14149.1 Putative Ca2+-binding protein [Salinispira pacifica]